MSDEERAALSTRYEAGDEVAHKDTVGVVTEVFKQPTEFGGKTVPASADSPTYIVATAAEARNGTAVRPVGASSLEATTIETEGVDDPAEETAAAIDIAAATADDEAGFSVTGWRPSCRYVGRAIAAPKHNPAAERLPMFTLYFNPHPVGGVEGKRSASVRRCSPFISTRIRWVAQRANARPVFGPVRRTAPP